MLAGLMQVAALVGLIAPATAPTKEQAQLEFRDAPELTVVRCLEGCGRLTGTHQLASTFRPITLSEPQQTVSLRLLSEGYLPRTVTLTVHRGRNIVDATMTPRT
ncbi:MAG: hypothetical protein AAF799_48505 [Myxococcota bacterium]